MRLFGRGNLCGIRIDLTLAEKCVHINFGMVLGMSTRKGTVKFLNDILADVGDKMHEVMKSNQAKYVQIDVCTCIWL